METTCAIFENATRTAADYSTCPPKETKELAETTLQLKSQLAILARELFCVFSNFFAISIGVKIKKERKIGSRPEEKRNAECVGGSREPGFRRNAHQSPQG